MTFPELPIDAVLSEVVASLETSPNLILAAPPGAGKTTRVPLALMDAGWATGKLLVLEPRRIAARAAAERMASMIGDKIGQRVGYRIRGEAKVSQGTKVEVITEGILTRMLQSEPDLPGVSGILFDEVHERSIHTDLGLALCLEVQEALRPELRLVAMSATLDVDAFSRIMDDPVVVESEGRAFPVETRWLARPWRRPGEDRRALPAAVAAQVRAALTETDGDILVFLPGAGEIRRTETLLTDIGVPVQPLYGALPFKAQQQVLRPGQGRRVVLATAIAETSLTVPGVRVVVDAGFSRRAEVDRATGLSRLVTTPVSRAEADQRRGRAGRVAPGVCYRMWPKGAEGALATYPPPEITSTDLAPLALELAAWGTKADDLRFIDPPPAAGMEAAGKLLFGLGALSPHGAITEHGRALARKPLHPRLAHLVLKGAEMGAAAEAALLAATLAERDPLGGNTNLWDRLAAVLTPAANADKTIVARIRDDARRIAPGKADKRKLESLYGQLAAHAYPDRIAMRRTGDAPRYLLSNGRGAVLRNGDALSAQRLLVATDLEDGTDALIRSAAPLSEQEVRENLPHLIEQTQAVEWSSRDQAVLARYREMLGAIALTEKKINAPPIDAVAAALVAGIRERGIDRLPWPKSALALRARSIWVRAGGGGVATALPDWTDCGLTTNLEDWLVPHLQGQTRIEQLSALDLTTILRTTLSWEQAQTLDRLAPSHFTTPIGSKIAIDYSGDRPTVPVRVQELFGLTKHPLIGDPSAPLALALLSPAGRPVQVTSDLPGFWDGSYADVRKDMRARYPKHPWPDDPATAPPTRRRKSTKS